LYKKFLDSLTPEEVADIEGGVRGLMALRGATVEENTTTRKRARPFNGLNILRSAFSGGKRDKKKLTRKTRRSRR